MIFHCAQRLPDAALGRTATAPDRARDRATGPPIRIGSEPPKRWLPPVHEVPRVTELGVAPRLPVSLLEGYREQTPSGQRLTGSDQKAFELRPAQVVEGGHGRDGVERSAQLVSSDVEDPRIVATVLLHHHEGARGIGPVDLEPLGTRGAPACRL